MLDTVLGKLARQHDPNVLVGFDHADDAGVYQLTPETALVQTVDFFTPIVDDPYIFGQIAATNALSDVYAMGGKPLTSLALVCFPDKADITILERILAGGLSKMVEAGCTVSRRPQHPRRRNKIWLRRDRSDPSQARAREPGRAARRPAALHQSAWHRRDFHGHQEGQAKQSWIDVAVKSMTTLNKTGAEVIANSYQSLVSLIKPLFPEPTSTNPNDGKNQPSDSCPHRRYRLRPDRSRSRNGTSLNVGLIFDSAKVPVIEGALECIRAGFIPGGLKANREFAECLVGYAEGVPEEIRTLLFDPQTAGGLLISAAAADSGALSAALQKAGVTVVEIGEVVPASKPLISVR